MLAFSLHNVKSFSVDHYFNYFILSRYEKRKFLLPFQLEQYQPIYYICSNNMKNDLVLVDCSALYIKYNEN
jgi:hypothetical protein